MPELKFDVNTHSYFLDNIPIPGYSQIARDLGLVDYSRCNKADLEWKRQLGQAVHTAILWSNAGELNMDSLDQDTTARFNSWLKFVELYQPKIITEYSEKPICSFIWRYGVTPDIIAELKQGLTIIELKTTAQMNPVTALQTEAQKIAIEETHNIKIKQRWGLQLIPDAMPKLEVYADMSDHSAWLSCVNVWQWRHRNNLLKG